MSRGSSHSTGGEDDGAAVEGARAQPLVGERDVVEGELLDLDAQVAGLRDGYDVMQLADGGALRDEHVAVVRRQPPAQLNGPEALSDYRDRPEHGGVAQGGVHGGVGADEVEH